MLAVWNFKYYGCIDLFRIIQKRKDLILFKLRLNESIVDESTIQKELQRHLRKTLNMKEDETTFEVEFVDEMPLDKTGKFQIVDSEVN